MAQAFHYPTCPRPTGWSQADKNAFDQMMTARKHPGVKRHLTYRLMGFFLGKTPGQVNRHARDHGYAPTRGPRKKRAAPMRRIRPRRR